MTSRDLLMLAKQGDPKVISTLLNHVIQPKGIKAQVAKRDGYLHILVESDRKLNQQAVVTFIQSSIKTLRAESISAIRIYGRQTGQKSFDWNQEIQLSWDYTEADFSTNPVSSYSEPPPEAPESIPEPVLDLEPVSDPSPTDLETHSPTPPIESESSLPLSTDSEASIQPESLSSESSDSDFSDFEPTPSTGGELARLPSIEFPLEDDSSGETASDLLRRPEAVILLIFVSVIMLWQMYLDLLGEADADGSISGRELARRLGVNNSTISRRKDRPDFPAWTQDLDPDGIAWAHQDGIFVPTEV